MKWIKKDDKILISIYDKNKSWIELTTEFNLLSNNTKNHKQLQQRWTYFLDPKLKLSPLSIDEFNIIEYFYLNKSMKNNLIVKEILLKTGIKRSTHFIKNNIMRIKNKLKKKKFTTEEDINLYSICKENNFIWTKVYKNFKKRFKHTNKTIMDLKYRWEYTLKKYTESNLFSEEEDTKLYNICVDNNITWFEIYKIFSKYFPNRRLYNDLMYRWHLYLNPDTNPIYIS
jgi:hypothetical protein